MAGDTSAVARLLERAQCGEHDEALLLAEEALREPTGDLADGAAGMHFVRFVAQVVQGRTSEALAAVDHMLQAADREGNQGWRSCALSGRAWQHLMLGEHLAEREVDAVLQDLIDAGIALAPGVEDGVIAENAHTGVALGYHQLRLYELALPQYEAAYAVSAQDGRQAGNKAMWQSNIATLHLEWALELYRVRQPARPSNTTGTRAYTPPWQPSRPAAPTPNCGVSTPTCSRGVQLPTVPTRQVRRGP